MLPIAEPGQRHLLNQIVRFSQALHAEGVPVNSANLIDFCRSLSFIDIGNQTDFYAAARATLVASEAAIPVFDQVFTEFWHLRDETLEQIPEEEEADGHESDLESGQQRDEAHLGTREHKEQQAEDQSEAILQTWSPHHVLTTKDFDQMSEKEIEQTRVLLRQLVALLATDRSRRRIASRRGSEIHPRRMLRKEAVFGADNVELLYRRRKIKKPRLLLLCDVSGSMERYSRFLIQFIYAMRQQLTGLDVAVFSTSMTVITDLLRRQSVDQSLAEVAEVVHDWSGGTNIGNSLVEFNETFSRDLDHRRTVVIILSDGWDRGDAGVMRREIEYLHLRTEKLMWLNPLLGDSRYDPLCRGMQTALPFIDYFLPAHNLESLANVIRLLRTMWRK